MSMNLIAILVSLAMMLTGAGGATLPADPAAPTARTLTLSNVSVSWNGETLRLDPQARIGVATDGTKALYDFSVEAGDKTLLPLQLSAGEAGITALAGNSGIAVNVTAEALAALAAQLEGQLNDALGEDGAGLAQFITEEYLPAYAGALRLATDPARRQQVNDAAQAVFDRVVDQGEGTPAKVEVDGVDYDVIAYSYSLDAMQMAALSDAVYAGVPEFNDYYSALFKLYAMLPEESGLRGLDSFSALFERFGLDMRIDVEEQRSADGAVDVMDTVLTMDPNGMTGVPQGLATAQATLVAPADAEPTDAAPADGEMEAVPEGEDQMAGAPLEAEAGDEAEGDLPEAVEEAGDAAPEAGDEAEGDLPEAVEGAAVGEEAGAIPEAADIAQAAVDAPEAPGLAPIVMNLHSAKLPEYSESEGTFSYALDDRRSVDFTVTSSESEGVQEMEAKAILTEDGRRTQGGRLSVFVAYDETGTVSYSLGVKAIQQDAAKLDAVFYGVEDTDGTSENSVAFELHSAGLNAAVSFDLNVSADDIEDATAAATPACVIDDLSEAGIQALGQDPAVMGTLMQALGSLIVDVNTLKAEPGLEKLQALVRGEGLPIDVDELDEEDSDLDIDFDEVLDGEDGDYDLVLGDDGDYQLVVGDGDASAFDFDDEPVEDDGVLAFPQPRLTWLPSGWAVTAVETDTAYDWVQMTVTDKDGAECAYAIFFLDPEAGAANYIVQDSGKVVDGRMMNVTDFGEGGLSVTVSEDGMYANLMFNSEAIELDAIGRIVAGIEF